MGAGHDHKPRRREAGGPDDGAGFDWFGVVDIAVWAAVVVLGVVAIEWMIGRAIRESISDGATRYLAKAAATKTEE